MTSKLTGIIALWCIATAAAAATIPDGHVDGRSRDYQNAITRADDLPVFHHFPYKTVVRVNQLEHTKMAWDVSPKDEVPNCAMMTEAKAALIEVLKEVNIKPLADGRKLFVTSCFRSIKRQIRVFCKPPAAGSPYCREPARRAVTSAPSGYSEHDAGYTIDFTTCTVNADNNPISCADLTEDAFKNTSAFQWLAEIAHKNGFEMSFPLGDDDNWGKDWDGKPVHLTKQGVAYEPWHWRWVGTNDNFTDAAKAARMTFARARKCFKADPDIPPISDAPETDKPIVCPTSMSP